MIDLLRNVVAAAVRFLAPRATVENLLLRQQLAVLRRSAAEVVVMNGFSAHADQRDLVDFVTRMGQAGSLDEVILVHGEPGPQKALSDLLRAAGIDRVHSPGPGDRLSA